MICVSRLLFYAYVCGRLMFIRIAMAFAICLCLMPFGHAANVISASVPLKL